MKLIVPMAGRGTRLRPHTHVTPKPLLPVAGRSMVERIVETFAASIPGTLNEAVFILGPDFGEEVRVELNEICGRHGMIAHFGVQKNALGTAHAVVQAGDHLAGECIVVFADTLFYMDGSPDLSADAVIWVKEVPDPSRFGVVVKDGERITDFVEKPTEFISDLAIIGIYYVKEGAILRRAIEHLIDHNITGHGEFQLTDALDRMLKEGLAFTTSAVSEWLDCGTIPALMETSAIVLAKEGEHEILGRVENSTIHEPVFLAEGAVVRNSEIGPNVAIESRSEIVGSTIKNSIVFGDSNISNSTLDDSVVGHHAEVRGFAGTLNIGDHATVG